MQITAVLPLIGLTYVFHKTHWTPPVLPEEWLGQGFEKGTKVIQHYRIQVTGEQFGRLAFEFAAAYATVKVCLSLSEFNAQVLLPLRILLSVWATPQFARWIVI